MDVLVDWQNIPWDNPGGEPSRLRKKAGLRGARLPSGVAEIEQRAGSAPFEPQGGPRRPVPGPLPYVRAGSASKVRKRTRL